MRISDWSSDVCSSDLVGEPGEQILLDVNSMAAGKDYFNVGEYGVSQDNRLLAWAEDDVGRRQYTIRFRNLDTGEACPDVITGVSPNLVWADDNRTVFYRSEEHTSELQSLMRISYAVFCLKKKNNT